MAAAAAGVSGREALGAISAAYRQYAQTAPGRYAASVRAPTPGDQEYADVTSQALAVISAALKGYHLDGPDLIHAIRMWRAACHGLASLEMAGGFGLPQSVDATFERLIDALDHAFRDSSAP
jgi:hypothetical protein